MPFDVLVVSVAVTSVFVGFAAVLAWADHWSRRPQAGTQADAPMPKRRSF
jgi:hypothetical protein